MISPAKQKLTAQFYEWELLGRGWLLGNEPVQLEPPFTPFFGHLVRKEAIKDDGLRPTLLSSIASAFKAKQHVIDTPLLPEISYDPFLFEDSSPLSTLRLILPQNCKVNTHETEQFLSMLSYCSRPVSFEIIGTHKEIILQFVSKVEDASYIKNQLKILFPAISVLQSDTDQNVLVEEYKPFSVIDFGLKDEFMRTLATSKTMPIDSFTGMLSILENLEAEERAIIQVLFNCTINHWQSSILRSVTGLRGDSFFEDAPEMLPMAKEKVCSDLFAVTIRIATQANTLDKSSIILDRLSFALTINSRSQGNILIPLSDEEYTSIQRVLDIIYRESHRVGMLLNTKELATFVHIPDVSLVSKKLLSNTRKTKSAPPQTEGHIFKLGKNIHQGIERDVSISNEQRLKHTHIIGATGTGKSTLLLNMICQDIANGQGIAVLDPHGDLIETILSNIPRARIKDVVIVDPSDTEFPIGFNILKAHSDIEKEVLSSDLVAAFRRLSTSWGDQMNSVFANTILAFLESTTGGTLADMRRFLIEKPFREQFLETVQDPNIIYYWRKEYPLLKTNSIGPILTRLDTFLRPRLIRNMVAQSKGIDFESILNTKKILLVKLSQGLIGTENSFLLGTFVVSKIHQAALARQVKDIRNDFFLYIDEFQHFITPSMSHILSGARKYHLGLILAHQDLQQLQKYDSELLHSLIANAGTRICFRMGDMDAKKIADGFSFFEVQDLQNLHMGEAIIRIERPEYDFSLSTFHFVHLNSSYAEKDSVIDYSRNHYGTSKADIEKILNKHLKDLPVEEVKEKEVFKRESIKSAPLIASQNTVQPKSSERIPEGVLNSLVKQKEETQHRYLQNLIKKMAESKGYKATLETQTNDGRGKVDVSIESTRIKIACEVSVTTDSSWELHNIEKCLASGYDKVFVCCTQKSFLTSLQSRVKETLSTKEYSKVIVCEPETLFEFLDVQSIEQMPTETKMKGYRVKVEYDSISHEEQTRKKESVAKIVLESLRRMKK
jgi:hypothetical protein